MHHGEVFQAEYGLWQTVYKRVARWAQLSVWDKLLEELEKSADLESISIDASYVKLHQHGTGAKGALRTSDQEK